MMYARTTVACSVLVIVLVLPCLAVPRPLGTVAVCLVYLAPVAVL